MTKSKISVLLLISIFLTSCVGGSSKPLVSFYVGGNRFVVHELKGNERGNIILKSTNRSLEGDLIYRQYEKSTSDYLIQKGFRTVTSEKDAQYVGFINYGFLSNKSDKQIVDVKINEKSIYFETQNLETSNPTPLHRSIFSDMRNSYERVLIFKMYDLTTGGLKGKMILDSKVNSVGSCDNMGPLREDLTMMMFKNFPGESGKAERITIPSMKVNAC